MTLSVRFPAMGVSALRSVRWARSKALMILNAFQPHCVIVLSKLLVVTAELANSDQKVARNGHRLDLALMMPIGTTICRFSDVYDLYGLRIPKLAEKMEAVTANAARSALRLGAGVPWLCAS